MPPVSPCCWRSRPTWAALPDEFGVSRSRLRSLFAEAGADGYVRLSAGRGRPIEIFPSLWDANERASRRACSPTRTPSLQVARAERV